MYTAFAVDGGSFSGAGTAVRNLDPATPDRTKSGKRAFHVTARVISSSQMFSLTPNEFACFWVSGRSRLSKWVRE
jgi:hypothetical protein